VGTYNCNLKISNNSLTETTIPVTLEVIPYSGIQETGGNTDITVRPNPFNEFTTISMNLMEQSSLSVDILDLSGRLIRNLIDLQNVSSGKNSVIWDGKGNDGTPVSAGLYLCRIRTGDDIRILRLGRVK
jgi:flagellar hook assembly protein FlgD